MSKKSSQKVNSPKVKSRDPKVLVCRLITDRKNYCIKELIDSSKSLTYNNKTVLHFDNSMRDTMKDTLEFFDLNVIKTDHWMRDDKKQIMKDKKGTPIALPVREMMVRDMNMAREMVLKQGYDYMLILEQDIIPHPDIIEKLLSYDKDIMSAFYWLDWTACEIKNRDSWGTPINYYEFKKTDDDKVIPNIIFQPDPNVYFYPSRVIEYAHSGFGCTLVSKKVLEKVKFSYDPEQLGQVDAHFYRESIINGFVPYLDTGLIVRHDHKDWSSEFKQ